MTIVDNFLDKITMYRLLLYGLICLVVIAIIYSFMGLLPYSPGSIILSTGVLVFVSVITNGIFSNVFDAPTNVESVYITALILALIINPLQDLNNLPLLIWGGILAMASKYLLAINKKHLFNPAAAAAVLSAFWLGDSARWWVGTTIMTPFVLLFGLLIVRKIRRGDMIACFFLLAFITEGFFSIVHGVNMTVTLKTLIFHSSLLFFGFVMVTEPLTTPPTKGLRMFYGGLVGYLFSPHLHLGSVYSTPELALIIGNIFSYLVSPKQKFYLHLQEKISYGANVVDFIFNPVYTRMNFAPGQYMEWTLPHEDPDERGNRRYFTIASSPTEESIHLGIKFYPQGSSFKKALLNLTEKVPISASQIAGDFTLPSDPGKKLVFIAGGIGITPFRSMLKYCIDTNNKRSITLFYSCRDASEIAYSEILDQAEKIGIKIVYILSDTKNIPPHWPGKIGPITPEMIKAEVPDYLERIFYISGPHPMVTSFTTTLSQIGISKTHIKTDFFPGYV